MSLLGFLKFALNFLDLLAWPLFALGYPLCASIRAIENNSNSETQKLVTYWISFSLVSLFEHSFVNLLQWIQFWPYIKLMIICWLLIPYFDGASYVYNDFVCPCLLLNPQVIVDEFNKWRVLLWKRDHFLAEAEIYIKGNGPEALEKLIDKEFKTKMPNVDVDDIKAIVATEKKEVEWSPNNKLEIVQKDNKVVEVIEKKEVSVVKRMVIAEPSLDQTDNKTLAINEIKGPDVVVAAARELPEIPTESEKTLNICQVTIESEKNKASYEAPEANWPNIVNFGSFLTVLDSSEKITYQPIEKPQEIESTNGLKWQGQPKRYDRPQKQVPKKSVSNIGLKQKIFLADEKKTQGWQKNAKKEAIGVNKNTFNYCNICNIRCSGKGNLVSHFQGKKHLAKVQVIYGCGDVGDSSKSGNNICGHDQDMDWDAPPVVCGNGWDWEPASPVVSGHGWDWEPAPPVVSGHKEPAPPVVSGHDWDWEPAPPVVSSHREPAPPVVSGHDWDWEPASPVVSGHGWGWD